MINNKSIQASDSYILNYIVPNFEKNPTENAKYMVKLILEKGMNPNNLREKFLRNLKDSQVMPERIMDVNPISLACMKYQNNALNFIIKYNATIREIIYIEKKVSGKKGQTWNNYIKMLDKSK